AGEDMGVWSVYRVGRRTVGAKTQERLLVM
ncbi:unnamed protein product, partial [marine sediment metagenome]